MSKIINNEEKMLHGELYKVDENLENQMKKRQLIINELNLNKDLTKEKKIEIYNKLFGSYGKNFVLNPPFYCDYGKHIYMGDDVYINYDCIFLDVAPIKIGNRVFIAPRVSLYTAGHPIDKDIRNEYLEFGKPITIGDDVWIGGNVVINPGVTIGNNVVIGSGSVVTKDIPSNVVALGNPCKVLRKITEEDHLYWQNLKQKYYE